MAAMAGLPLRRPPNSPDGQLSASLEGDPGLHVIWGEVESIGRGDSRSSRSGSRTESGFQDSGHAPRLSADGRKPNKLQNKRLNDANIQFRQLTNSQSGSASSNTDSDSFGQEPKSPGRSGGTVRQQLKVLQLGDSGSGKSLEQQVALEKALNGQHGDDQEDDVDDEDEQGQAQTHQVLAASVTPEELARVTATVRRNEKGVPTSLGSEGHDDNCRACLFVFTAAGCQNGVLCSFCHFKHKRANRPRPCKGKRNRFRKLAARVEQLHPTPEAAATENNKGQLPPKFTL